MKHFTKYGIDSTLKNISGFITAFLTANIRTTFTYPRTIWYSLRYNAGEKFILHSKILYPFKYQSEYTINQDKEPVWLSTSVITNVLEFQLQPFKNVAYNNESDVKSLTSTFQANLHELYKLFQYNKENENFDVPVAVPARTLYAIANFNKIMKHAGKNVSEEFEKETLYFMINCFVKKLEFADSESISQVLYAIEKLNLDIGTEVWNKIIQDLAGKNFEVEFTHVSPYFPQLFRYHEVEERLRKNGAINDLGNNLFLLGYKSVFETYYAIRSATQKNEKLNTGDFLNSLKEKFRHKKQEYYEYVKHL